MPRLISNSTSSTNMSISVLWQPNFEGNICPIKFYVVAVYNESGNLITNQSQQTTNADIDNLQPFSNYTVSVIACGDEGNSFELAIKLATKQGCKQKIY